MNKVMSTSIQPGKNQSTPFLAPPNRALRIKIVSDIHLGYRNSDRESFTRFIDSLQLDKETTDLVLLGDVVDMWRRDACGVFLENWDIINKLLLLKEKMRVHYIAGNHDYHVLQMQGYSYPFTFTNNLEFVDGKHHYIIKHGYEFDPIQKPIFMEALCHIMFDPIETFENLLELTQPPERRLLKSLEKIEHHVCQTVKRHQILVFGHTHHPFINKAENVVNSGSWVTDSPIHNTVVELYNGKPKLTVFEESEITERVHC